MRANLMKASSMFLLSTVTARYTDRHDTIVTVPPVAVWRYHETPIALRTGRIVYIQHGHWATRSTWSRIRSLVDNLDLSGYDLSSWTGVAINAGLPKGWLVFPAASSVQLDWLANQLLDVDLPRESHRLAAFDILFDGGRNG